MAEDDEDDDDLAGPMPELDDLTVEGDDPAGLPLAPAVLRRFLSQQRALDIAAAAIRPIVPAQEVDDLAADAVVRAVRARPPRVEKALPAWLAEIARRVAIRFLEKRRRRAKYEGPMPVAHAREDGYTGQAIEDHAEPTRGVFDEGAAEEAEDLVDEFLESIVAPHDRPILELLREHATTKKTYGVLASERGMSPDQLDRKMRRFKVKYGPRVRRRRAVMAWLRWGGGVALVVAALAVAWYFLHRGRSRGDVSPDPETLPLPSATASAEPPLVADRQREARELRDSALAECRASRWAECLRRLDAAKTLDPAGDDAPDVKRARAQATEELQRRPPDLK